MKTHLHDKIVVSNAYRHLSGSKYRNSVSHIHTAAGRLVVSYHDRTYELTSSTLAVFVRHDDFNIVEASPDYRCEMIIVDEELLISHMSPAYLSLPIRQNIIKNPVIKLEKEEADSFSIIMGTVKKRMNRSHHVYYTEIIGCLLRHLMYDVMDVHVRRFPYHEEKDRVGWLCNRFFSMLNNGLPNTHREVEYYASQIKVTPKYLGDTIKRVTGESASTHINRAAVPLLCGHLEDHSLSLSQIAEIMHFNSLSYFTRYCKSHLGITPTRYRQMNLRQNQLEKTK